MQMESNSTSRTDGIVKNTPGSRYTALRLTSSAYALPVARRRYRTDEIDCAFTAVNIAFHSETRGNTAGVVSVLAQE